MPAPRVPTILVLVAVPLSACSPLDVRYGQRPTRVIDVEGVALTGWRAA
jgi:hypothetical protein